MAIGPLPTSSRSYNSAVRPLADQEDDLGRNYHLSVGIRARTLMSQSWIGESSL